MNTAYLILGTNLGNRLLNLDEAIRLIAAKAGTVEARSKIYVTAAWGKTDQPDFYNQAIRISCGSSASELLRTLLDIEKQMGRYRNGEKWAERLIDIDILFFNNAVINEEHLHIPHPHIAKRLFVLVPMEELAPELEHPVSGKSIKAMREACKDMLAVSVLKQNDQKAG
jgi:2-amino-4-hydroxy-6-hydroxymethyldihydropteridine diphosphokinase